MAHFLQSPEWELFQKSLGRSTRRIRGALCIAHAIPMGFRYLYVPHPEILEKDFPVFLKEASSVAESAEMLFLKIDPLAAYRIKNVSFQIRTSESIQPEHSLILDLSKSDAVLLREMHGKTRYNIKVAEKHGIAIRVIDSAEEKLQRFESFWELLSETASRDRFHTHEKEYYTKLLAVDSPEYKTILILALKGDNVAAGAILNIYKGRAVYLHGASSDEYRSVMAPYLLHWTAIREARKRGCGEYDFWGIDPKKWPGVTRFKKGFGGREILYPKSFDIVYRPFWYALYRLKKIFY